MSTCNSSIALSSLPSGNAAETTATEQQQQEAAAAAAAAAVAAAAQEYDVNKPPLSRSHAQHPVGRKLMIRTEFVYIDDDPSRQAAESVSVCGDWNAWKSLAMMREQGRTWYIVTPVTNGYHEFHFVVDGVKVTSQRHPTMTGNTSGRKVNWRIVMGPADYGQQQDGQKKRQWFSINGGGRTWLARWGIVGSGEKVISHNDDDMMMMMTLPNTVGDQHSNLHLRTGLEMNAFKKQGHHNKRHLKDFTVVATYYLTEMGIVGFVVGAVLAYLLCSYVYSVAYPN